MNERDRQLMNANDSDKLARIAAIRANRGLPPDPASDRIWLGRINAGQANFDTVRSRVEAKASQPSQSKPEPDPSLGLEPLPGIQAPKIDYRSAAQALHPWLTPALLDEYTQRWIETGDSALALAYTRGTAAHAAAFPGIRRDDGTLRMNEAEYFSTKAGFTEILSEFGQDPSQWQPKYADLFKADVSAQEFGQAVSAGFQTFVEPGTTPNQQILDSYIGGFFDTGSTTSALEAARSSSTYDSLFAGNRRDDGSLRMAEPEYFQYRRDWRSAFIVRGLNPEPFEAQGRLVESIERELSVQELDSRLQSVENGILSNTQETRDYFLNNYDLDFQGAPQGATEQTMALAMAIDPQVGRDILERRITASQIGGEAALRGFARSIERSEMLARLGVDQTQARQLYTQAGSQLGTLDALARRHNDPDSTFGLGEFEDAAIGDPEQRRRMRGRLADEASTFSGLRDTRADQSGALTGLRQR